MKFLISISLISCLTIHFVNAQTNYNQKLADSLGADEYGMKYYTLVLLKTGPNSIEDKDKVTKLFRSHMQNIQKMASDGKLIVAGPFDKNDKQYRGLFIIDSTDPNEIKKLMQNDGAIEAGLLAYDVIKWYGSAALPTYLPTHEKIQKITP